MKDKLEYAHKLVKDNQYSPLKAVKIAEVSIEDYNKYVEGLDKKAEPKVEETVNKKTNKKKK